MSYMWRKYYIHYHHLATNLRIFGYDGVLPTDVLEIVLGDPTSIILLNPYVSIIFIVDVWVSIEFVSRAIVSVNQLVDLKMFAVACFYLSRTLWFAYGALIGVSYLLKKLHREESFNEADPTLTAMAVMITAGPITNAQSHTLVFIDLYYYLFRAFSNGPDTNEATLPVVVYTLLIGTLPITFGFLSKYSCRCFRHKTVSYAYGSFSMNDVKHRLINFFNLMTFSEPAGIIRGGSLYDLFARDRKFKRNLGMSQRGADCYLIFGTGKSRTSVRLSLLSCLDPQHQISTSIDMTAAVGRLRIEKDKVFLVHGAYKSPWIS